MPRTSPSKTVRALRFQKVDIPTGLSKNEYAENGGCSELHKNVRSKLRCALLCGRQSDDWCVSFYYNKAKQECRLILYTDATVDVGSTENWIKVVVK